MKRTLETRVFNGPPLDPPFPSTSLGYSFRQTSDSVPTLVCPTWSEEGPGPGCDDRGLTHFPPTDSILGGSSTDPSVYR